LYNKETTTADALEIIQIFHELKKKNAQQATATKHTFNIFFLEQEGTSTVPRWLKCTVKV